MNYWDCKYQEYDEIFDGEEEWSIYGCAHPEGNGMCQMNGINGNCPFEDKEDICIQSEQFVLDRIL